MRSSGKPALCESSASALNTTNSPQDYFLRIYSLPFAKILIKDIQT